MNDIIKFNLSLKESEIFLNRYSLIDSFDELYELRRQLWKLTSIKGWKTFWNEQFNYGSSPLGNSQHQGRMFSIVGKVYVDISLKNENNKKMIFKISQPHIILISWKICHIICLSLLVNFSCHHKLDKPSMEMNKHA